MSGIGAWYRQFKNEYEYFNEVSAPIPISVSVHPYFKPLRRSVLPMVFLVTVVPAALRLFTSSPCVVLGLFCTFRMITDTARGDILHGAPDLERWTVVPFTNNRTSSCLLLTKLLADGFVTHSSLVQVYNLISDVL